jgi:hypothetical protein
MVCETTSPLLANPSARKPNWARANCSDWIGTTVTECSVALTGLRSASSDPLTSASRASRVLGCDLKAPHFLGEGRPIAFRLPAVLGDRCVWRGNLRCRPLLALGELGFQGSDFGDQIVGGELGYFAQLQILRVVFFLFPVEPLSRGCPAGQRLDHARRLLQHLRVSAAGHHAGEPSQEIDDFGHIVRGQ